MASGIEMMLKSFGFDPKKLIDDFEQLKQVTTDTLTRIDQRLEAIQKRQEEIWQMNQTSLRMSSQIQLQPQPQAQSQPQQPQLSQSDQPMTLLEPPNQQPPM